MKVLVVENGERPNLFTKARTIAPQAATYLANILEDEVFADTAGIVIDWTGSIGWSGDGPVPDGLKQEIMWVEVVKHYPQNGQTLRVDYKLDLDDFFGRDNATGEDLHEIVENLRAKVYAEEKRKGI